MISNYNLIDSEPDSGRVEQLNNRKTTEIICQLWYFSLPEWKKFTEKLKNNTSLQLLNLTVLVNYGGSLGINGLDTALKSNSTLKTLILRNTNLVDKDLKLLAEGLKTNNGLTTLDLSMNKMTDKAIEHLIEALKINTSLQSLNLQICRLKNKHVALILNNTKLLTLDVSENKLDTEGLEDLTLALRSNTHLQTLDLSRNYFTDSDISLLGTGLIHNISLQSLDLSHLDLDETTVEHFVLSLKPNTSLQDLQLNCYVEIELSQETQEKVDHYLARNKKYKEVLAKAVVLIAWSRPNQTSGIADSILPLVAYIIELASHNINPMPKEKMDHFLSWTSAPTTTTSTALIFSTPSNSNTGLIQPTPTGNRKRKYKQDT